VNVERRPTGDDGTVVPFPIDRLRPRRLVPLAELRELYGFGERWWRYRVAEGMPAHRFGRRALRFDPAEVERWMEDPNGAP
jgi:predicted DNA-binding transcriptional regulator AlpA